MNRIDATFAALKKQRRKALIGYVTAGFPTKQSLFKLIPLLEQAGLDLVEIGVPFSDPIADGPTIQQASQKALENGVTLVWILNAVRTLRRSVRLPIVFMSYSNPIYSMGVSRFFARASQAGADGLIIPDLIPEEASLFRRAADRYGVHLIFLAAPTTPDARLAKVAAETKGFLYAVSLTGVTGARQRLPSALPTFLKKLSRASRVPVAVGFGLSTPDHVRAAARFADGVIVGSALIKEIDRSKANGFTGAARYIRSLKNALPSRKELAHAS